MELKKFEKILKNNGYIEEYYDIIFKLLLDDNLKSNGADRTEIFNTIKELKFYSYDYTWHLRDNGQSILYHKLFEINKFIKLNQAEIGCDIFLKNNLFPILKSESDYYFTKKSMIYKEYDDETESSRTIPINFLSPLFLYNLLLVNDLFINDINSLILDKLTSIEDSYFNNIKHPIIKDGIDILNESLEKPEKFENFVLFWSEYKKLLLSSNSIENDLEIVKNVSPKNFDLYKSFTNNNENYNFGKTVLAQKVTEFFFTHFENFNFHKNKIPNALLWICESQDFLKTQKLIDNVEVKHLEYFAQFNNNSVYEKFLGPILFNMKFPKDITYKKVKTLLTKNFNFELLVNHYNDSNNNKSNFENYVLSLENYLDKKDLLSLYRNSSLNYKLNDNGESKRKIKI